MYDELVNSLRICGKMRSVDDYCVAFHDGCCEAEPVCMYELMMQAADAIEELQKRVPKRPHGRLVDADKLLSEPMKQKYYHLPNGDTAIPIIDVEHAPTVLEAEEGE